VASEARLSVEEATEQGLRVSAESDALPALDRRARDDYRARWRELVVEEADARHDNDVGRAARIQHEIDMLAEQLAAVAGDDGSGAAVRRSRSVRASTSATASPRRCAPFASTTNASGAIWRTRSRPAPSAAMHRTARSSGTCDNAVGQVVRC
jgi:hypothetical protein